MLILNPDLFASTHSLLLVQGTSFKALATPCPGLSHTTIPGPQSTSPPWASEVKLHFVISGSSLPTPPTSHMIFSEVTIVLPQNLQYIY
jgi:hypothetical protein